VERIKPKCAAPNTKAKKAIDVDALKTPPPQPKPAVWIDSGTVKLTIEDRKILKSPTAWHLCKDSEKAEVLNEFFPNVSTGLYPHWILSSLLRLLATTAT
jgi:hypothetical protein